MSTESNKQLIEIFYTVVWNGWDTAKAREILAENLEFRGSIGLEVMGVDGFIGYMETIRTAFPDFHNRIEEIVAEDEHAVARLIYSGTHEGELLGHPPSGKRVTYAGAAFFTFRDGRISKGLGPRRYTFPVAPDRGGPHLIFVTFS